MIHRRARSTVAVLVATVLCAPAFAGAGAASDAVARAASYLLGRQERNGSFGSLQMPADGVADTLAALIAAGARGEPVARALRYIRANGPARAEERAGAAGRIVLGLVAARQDPRAFGFDYVSAIESAFDPMTGSYDTGHRYANSLAALGLLAAERPLPDRASFYIESGRCSDGGFANVSCFQGGDTDTTAHVLMIGALAGDDPDERALAFLRSMQNGDGGFKLDAEHADTNANSTGLALSALAALREPRDARAVRALLRLQLPSGGSRFRASDERANDYATVQAIPGLLGMGYPLRAPVRPPSTVRPAPTRTATSVSGGGQVAVRSEPCARSARREGWSMAGLTVTIGTERARAVCVRFRERSITGFELLQRSKIPFTYKDYGGGNVFVCSIAGVGRDHPNESCEPPCPPSGSCTFWAYFTKSPGGAWSFADVGPSARVVRDGDTDGWRWTAHDGDGCAPDDPTCGRLARSDAPIPAKRSAAGPVGIAAFAVAMAGLGGFAVRFARRRGPLQ